jgi:adenosylhomocysteinase
MSEIRNLGFSKQGEVKIRWAQKHMPVLSALHREFEREKPLAGLRVSVSIHLEAKTAYLCRVLQAGGAQMAVTGSNPLSTKDDIAAALAAGGMEVFAWHGATAEEYDRHISLALAHGPHLVLDDGADLSEALHTRDKDKLPGVFGASEETTTGLLRLRAREKAGKLGYPVLAVNDADAKHLFDNRYGTGQSVWDGIMRTTNLVIAGKTVVVSGYGWCGKGVAMRAKGLGARVIVTEVDPIRAIEALMDGYDVMSMDEAAGRGDIFVTVTGCSDVVSSRHFTLMKDGAILTNAGHFNVEIDTKSLAAMAERCYEARENIMAYEVGGKTLYLIAEGRLVNLASGDGHPAEIMDLSFAIQALSLKYLAQNRGKLENRVYNVPAEFSRYAAQLKLDSMGIRIDSLTDAQLEYLYGEKP